MICQVCRIDDRGKRVRLVNGSWITLCAPHRARHEEMIAEVPIDGAEDLRAEEAHALEWTQEEREAFQAAESADILGHGGLR